MQKPDYFTTVHYTLHVSLQSFTAVSKKYTLIYNIKNVAVQTRDALTAWALANLKNEILVFLKLMFFFLLVNVAKV